MACPAEGYVWQVGRLAGGKWGVGCFVRGEDEMVQMKGADADVVQMGIAVCLLFQVRCR
jgi:hypothetical protein